jgi:serine/threonine protein kinase
MADEENKDLETDFSKRNETLRSFYNSDVFELSEDEQYSLTPILNSLKDSAARYREIEKIAEGGEKKITLVHDYRLDRRIAMARAVRNKGPQDLEQFLREARLTANLAHPNIMPVYNMGLDDDGEPFFSMELVPGDSLKAIIRKLQDSEGAYTEDYPRETLLNIFLKICDAIAYAHSRNVLHLDIKPDNIRVGEFGEVFVCDWGLARVMTDAEDYNGDDSIALDGDILNDMTLSGTVKGTPGFMAPEQTEAYGEKTPATDIYALGALLYMLLTYKLPVEGKSANELISNTRAGKVIPIKKRKAERRVPRGLAAVVMKALSPEPEKRYKSAVALRLDIARFLSGHPTKAERAGLITRISLALQRHSRIAFLLIFFLILLAFVVSGNLAAVSHEKAEAVTARNIAEKNRMEAELARRTAEENRRAAENAWKTAVKNREEADAARKKAEDNFALFKKEQQHKEALGLELGEAVSYTVRSRDFVSAPSMVRLLETGLSESVDTVKRQHLYEQKGILHFVLSEFNAANKCFDQAGKSKRIGQLKELSKKYAKLKPDDSMRLTDNQLAELFKESDSANQMTLFYLYYHHMRNRPASAKPEDYVALAGAVLDKLNYTRHSEGHPLRLEPTEGGYYMNLSGYPYTVYSINIIGVYRRNVLEPLGLAFLDISNSKMEHLYELWGMRLKELHMGGVPIGNKSASSFVNQVSPFELAKITLTVDDFPQKTVDALWARNVEVIDADAEKKAEAKRRAEEEARKKREAELKRQAEEKKRQEELARKKAEEEARKKAEAERKRKEEAARKKAAEEAALKKAEEEARLKKEAELKTQQEAAAQKPVEQEKPSVQQ